MQSIGNSLALHVSLITFQLLIDFTQSTDTIHQPCFASRPFELATEQERRRRDCKGFSFDTGTPRLRGLGVFRWAVSFTGDERGWTPQRTTSSITTPPTTAWRNMRGRSWSCCD